MAIMHGIYGGGFSGDSKMMRCSLLGFVLLSATAGVSVADEAARVGSGARTCATFTNDYATNPALTEPIYFAWAQGYMSALNDERLRTRNHYRNLAAMGIETLASALRQYCDNHPRAYYLQAVHDLYESLPDIRYRPGH